MNNRATFWAVFVTLYLVYSQFVRNPQSVNPALDLAAVCVVVLVSFLSADWVRRRG